MKLVEDVDAIEMAFATPLANCVEDVDAIEAMWPIDLTKDTALELAILTVLLNNAPLEVVSLTNTGPTA